MSSLRQQFHAVRLAFSALTGVLLVACGGGDGGGPIGPQTKPVATVAVTLAANQVLVGGTTQASVVLRDSDGATLTGRSVAWSSSATAVATVGNNGAVTAVGAGTAQIIATSEGKTGQAALTVVVDPASTASVSIGAITRNGVAVDRSKVAGDISIDIAETVPQGFTGTITVTIDTVLVSRTTYPAAVVADATNAGTSPRGRSVSETVASSVTRKNYAYNTATPIVTISGDDIAATGKLANIEHTLRAVMSGTVNGTPVNREDTETFTTANPQGSIVLAGRWNTPRTLLVDGRRYVTGESFTISAADLNYGTIPASAIEQIEIVHGGASATYGADAIAGVVNFITRKGEFQSSEFPCESGTLGTMFQVTGVTRSGIKRDPRIDPFVLNGITIDANRDGMPNVSPSPAGYNLGAGITGQVYIGDITLPNDWFMLNQPTWCDNVGPRLDLTSFSALGRNTTAWTIQDILQGRALPVNNVIPTDFDFSRWLNQSSITDGGVGLRTTDAFEYYVGSGTTASSVAIPSNKWTGTLSATAAYDRRVAFRAFDRFDNSSLTLAKTTTSNPIGIGGTPTSAGQDASFRVLATTPSAFTSVGIRDRTWSINTSYNPAFSFNVADVFGTNEQPIVGSLQRNGTYVIGSATNKVSIPTLRSGNEVSINFTQLLAQAGGTREGRWEGNFSGYNSAGLPFTPENRRIRFMYDFTNPSTPTSAANAFTAPFTAGQLIPFSMTATDNIHISQVGVSLRYQGFSTPGLFERDYVEAPFLLSSHWSPWMNPQSTWTGQYEGAVPTRIALASSGSNLVSPPYYDLTGYSLFSYDGLDRRSNFLDYAIPSNFLPAPKTFNNTRVSISANATNLCLERYDVSTACPGGYVTKAMVTGVALSPTADPQGIGQMHVYGIHNTTKQVIRLCRALVVGATTTVGSDTRQEFQCEADLGDYKGPAGQLTVFAWFISTSFWIAAKTQFLFWLMAVGAV